MQAIADFFIGIWDFIVLHAKNFWAGFVAVIVAILSFFGIRIGAGDPPPVTTTTTTAVVSTTKAPQTWSVNLAIIQALGLPEVTKTVTTQNSFGTIKSYAAQGPKLKDVLTALGADMSALNSRSVLQVKCTDPSDPASADYNYFLIGSDDSVFALSVGGSTADAPRLFAAVEPGQTYTDSGKCVKLVDTLILNYN